MTFRRTPIIRSSKLPHAFPQVAMANAEGSDIMLNRVMTKDNIALAALLEIKDSAWEPNPDPRVSGTPLLVATAHIHWDPEFSDVKLIQTMMLVDQVKKCAILYIEKILRLLLCF